MAPALHVIVLAAGEGKRLRSHCPKVLMPLWGRPSLSYPLDAVAPLAPERTVVVGGVRLHEVRQALADREGLIFAHQDQPLGTGHAVLAGREALAGATGSLLVLYGDGPLVTTELLTALVNEHNSNDSTLTILTVDLDDPTGYGRILRDDDGTVTAIVEEKDASANQRALCEVNAGLWILDIDPGLERLAGVTAENSQGEIYLTDLAALTVAAGQTVTALNWHAPEDVLGFNDQSDLAEVRGLLRRRILNQHLEAGVEIVDPETTYIDADVTIAPGARILPCTMIEGHVSIATGCDVGPFAHLRQGTVLDEGAKVGNFTETKNSRLGPGCKAGHLSYLGDADIGAGTNIGAGTITANYDGQHKHKTRIGEKAFVGSGTVLVAPADVGDGAMTGAGAVVTRGQVIAPGAVWVGVPARPLRSSSDPSDPSSSTAALSKPSGLTDPS
ncbi:MAG: bifunctional UDP-N-acetylglucosamine pyrophosphorylase/glucosamine-1-phosphate N-acetyltransferase [Pseudohongiellaceae bacterium]|jgi:bifunctional UDP-N-acetylglucosamine pyrophosphorylase/glucosamine-1-phosphate N-acetyltransferase